MEDENPLPGTDEYYRQMMDEEVFGDRRLWDKWPAYEMPQDRQPSAEAEEIIALWKNKP